MTEIVTALAADALDVAAAISAASTPEAGAVGVFVGTVRASAAVHENAGRAVTHLDYEAHPTLAPQKLRAIAEEAAERWGLTSVVALHRVGRCALGEPTVVVACSAAHRAEALDACRWLIDTLKETVPIWKRETYADGGAWVGTEGSR